VLFRCSLHAAGILCFQCGDRVCTVGGGSVALLPKAATEKPHTRRAARAAVDKAPSCRFLSRRDNSERGVHPTARVSKLTSQQRGALVTVVPFNNCRSYPCCGAKSREMSGTRHWPCGARRKGATFAGARPLTPRTRTGDKKPIINNARRGRSHAPPTGAGSDNAKSVADRRGDHETAPA
jgi:hypothetical protein